MSGELIWFLLPLAALCYMIGGTWLKQFRRIGIPVCAVIFTTLFAGFHWAWFIMAAWYFGKMTIPLTLIGDGIPDHGFNWVWVWIHGYLMGLPCFIFGAFNGLLLESLLLPLVPMAVHGFITTMSNLGTRKWFPHKLCEFITGAAVLYPLARLVEMAAP